MSIKQGYKWNCLCWSVFFEFLYTLLFLGPERKVFSVARRLTERLGQAINVGVNVNLSEILRALKKG